MRQKKKPTEDPATPTTTDRMTTCGSLSDWTPLSASFIRAFSVPLGLSGTYRLAFIPSLADEDEIDGIADDVPSFTVKLTPAMDVIAVMRMAVEKIDDDRTSKRDLRLDHHAFKTLTIRDRVIVFEVGAYR